VGDLGMNKAELLDGVAKKAGLVKADAKKKEPAK
jgi:hypothetical protein